jgi:hypothetical protein
MPRLPDGLESWDVIVRDRHRLHKIFPRRHATRTRCVALVLGARTRNTRCHCRRRLRLRRRRRRRLLIVSFRSLFVLFFHFIATTRTTTTWASSIAAGHPTIPS